MWIHEGLLSEFLVGFFPMALLRKRHLWLRTVPYFWIASMEEYILL
ncbi:hypothetical protein LOK49_LG07G03721 [Camellia lanceoleosa]|uniref:Uncharacterized protein n=1 Tax=Camellia lanceoleosa TaxID=1840588 RepID=A0ACC0GWN0_9ERIC|nr:hypothetical protein LOK49_LG07G03721 [Camellia lanceoleosa]